MEKPVIVEQFFDKPIESVWQAITDVDLMRHWYFDNIPSFKPEIGFKTQFNVVSNNRNFVHQWEVIKVVPFRVITYNWRYKDYQGNSNVEFELFEKGDGTLLRLSHHILESFPDDIHEFTRKSCIDGWTFFIKNSLKEFLTSKTNNV